jgi:hypothetical protein
VRAAVPVEVNATIGAKGKQLARGRTEWRSGEKAGVPTGDPIWSFYRRFWLGPPMAERCLSSRPTKRSAHLTRRIRTPLRQYVLQRLDPAGSKVAITRGCSARLRGSSTGASSFGRRRSGRSALRPTDAGKHALSQQEERIDCGSLPRRQRRPGSSNPEKEKLQREGVFEEMKRRWHARSDATSREMI